MTAIPQSTDNIHQNKVIPISEKTEEPHPQQHPQQQQQQLPTPPMSPINTSLSSNRPGTARSSLKITAGQTGLPWLTRDADGNNYSPIQQSPEQLTATEASPSTATAPPPKFLAKPRTASVIRFPTRRRTMQKHIYSMKDGLDPVRVLCNRLNNWQTSVKYLVCINLLFICRVVIMVYTKTNHCSTFITRFRLACFRALKRWSLIQERAIERSMQNSPSLTRSKVSSSPLTA